MFINRIQTLIFLSAAIVSLGSSCDGNKEKRPSPLTTDSISIGETQIKIEYSSPAVKKRKIWGELVPYGEIWRTGANRASFIDTNKDIKLENHLLPAGKYSIFTIPTDSTWSIIFNEDWDQWGAFNYMENKDAFRIKVKPVKSSFDERMKFTLTENELKFDWEELEFSLKLQTNL